MPGTVLSILHVFTYLTLITKLMRHMLFLPNFIDEKSEAWSDSVI